jgi:hypothetical protein
MTNSSRSEEPNRTNAWRKLEHKILGVPGTRKALGRLERKADITEGGNDPLSVLTHIAKALLESGLGKLVADVHQDIEGSAFVRQALPFDLCIQTYPL